jgi:hypothetical protein
MSVIQKNNGFNNFSTWKWALLLQSNLTLKQQPPIFINFHHITMKIALLHFSTRVLFSWR